MFNSTYGRLSEQVVTHSPWSHEFFRLVPDSESRAGRVGRWELKELAQLERKPQRVKSLRY